MIKSTILVFVSAASALTFILATGLAVAQPKDVPGAGFDARLDACWAKTGGARAALDACVAKPVLVCEWRALEQGSGKVRTCSFK